MREMTLKHFNTPNRRQQYGKTRNCVPMPNRVVHEDREELVVGDGVEGEEGVDEKVEIGLGCEDFAVGGFDLDGCSGLGEGG